MKINAAINNNRLIRFPPALKINPIISDSNIKPASHLKNDIISPPGIKH